MKILLTFLLTIFISSSLMAEDYNLNEFLDLVKKNSKDIKLAKEEVSLAKAMKKEATSGALPNISASAGYNRNLSDQYLFIESDEGTSKFKLNRNNEYSFSVNVNQALFNGTVINAIKAAKQYNKYIDYIYNNSYDQIMTYARKAFYQTLLLDKVWEVARLSEQNAHENYLDVKNSYEIGLSSEFDLLQAEVRYRDLIPQTAEAERNYQLSLINLENLAGINEGNISSLIGTLEDYPEIPANIEFEEILKNRSDYNAILWEEKLQQTNVSAEKSNYYPSLYGYFTYAYSAQSDQFKFEDENNAYMVGLNLSIPIFSGGATRAKVKQAAIALNKTSLNKEKRLDDIQTELKNIRLRLDESYSRIASAKVTLKTAEKAFSIAENTSKSGLISQLELKDSRVVLDQAKLNYYSSIYDYLETVFDWEKAAGIMNK